MQKVLGNYKNQKKLLNYSKQNPLQSFYKRNFICWSLIAISFEQRDIVALSVRLFHIINKITIKKFSKLWQFLFSHFRDVTSYSLVDIWMFKFEFHYLYDTWKLKRNIGKVTIIHEHNNFVRIKPIRAEAWRPKNELTESEKEWLKNF